MALLQCAQGEGTSRAVKLARLVNAPLYVVHVNSQDAAGEIEAGLAAGQRVWGEALAGGIALTDEPWWGLLKLLEESCSALEAPMEKAKESTCMA